jgi:hypothetical protein
VKLISADGLEFLVDREIVRSHSGTLRKMLDSNFKDATDVAIQLPEMSGYILERVIFYLHHKQQYSKVTGRVPAFVRFFHFICIACYDELIPPVLVVAQVIEPEASFKMYLAAKYLDC